MLRSNDKSRLLILLPSQFLESLNGDFHQMEMQYPELAEHGYSSNLKNSNGSKELFYGQTNELNVETKLYLLTVVSYCCYVGCCR